jgi:pyrimidine-nucleoside phosphorylase
MLVLGGIAGNADEGRAAIDRAIASGAALAKLREIVEAQGGDPRVCDDPSSILPRAPHVAEVQAGRDGYITTIDAEAFGLATVVLGGGRRRKEDAIDPAVGFVLHRKIGEPVRAGETIYVIHHRDDATRRAAEEILARAIAIEDAPPHPAPLVHEVLR